MDNIIHSKYSSYLFDRKFDMTHSHKQINIWKAYYDEDQIEKYHLYENKHIFLFNTTNLGYHGKHINQLNRLFCEGVCILYPYLNNLKSEIIGFQHYRRYFNLEFKNLKRNEIIEGKIQVFHHKKSFTEPILDLTYNNLSYHFNLWGIYQNGWYDDCIEYLKQNYPKYLNNPNDFHGFSLFICKWEKYIEFCDLLWGYFNFIANKYHFNIYSENDWVEFIKEKFILYNRDHQVPPTIFPWSSSRKYGENNWVHDNYLNDPEAFHYYRIFSFNVEYFVSMFANIEGLVIDKKIWLSKY